MMKHVYRGVACLLIFIVSIIIFSKNIKEKDNSVETVKEVAESSFPIMYVKYGEHMVNMMNGYTGNLNAGYIKDGMIPLEDNQSCEFYINEYNNNVKKVSYEIVDIQSDEVVEEGTVRNFGEKNEYKTFSIDIKVELMEEKEYAIKNALVSADGTKTYYYVRVKRTDSKHVGEIIDFANYFHESSLDKSKQDNIVPYIEVNYEMSSTDLSYVNIHSTLKMITFGNLAPKVVSDVYTNIRDAYDNTAMLELVYYAQAKTDSGIETYKVCEGYRIRWTATRMYVLFYERTMESVFDTSLLSLSANEFKLGITTKTDVKVTTNSEVDRICFVRDRTLWYYNAKDNEICSLYTFKQPKTNYVRDICDDNDIKVISVDSNGNTYFMAYGYMNSGDYEGRNAIVLFKYYAEQNRIEEMANIPLEVPFDVVKEQLNDFAYVNENEVFFFSIAGSIYYYSIPTDTMTTLAENVSVDSMVMSKKGGYIAWQTLDSQYDKINIMKLSNYKQSSIESKQGQYIKLLGVIGGSMIIGYADNSKTSTMIDGSNVIPLSLVNIVNYAGEVEKEYIPEGSFVTSAYVEGNKITLNRIAPDTSGKYIDAEQDCIFSYHVADVSEFGSNNRVTEKTMTEWYFYLPEAIQIDKQPKKVDVLKTIIKGDTTVRVFNSLTDNTFYYVYAYHALEKGFSNVADAIAMANERMGMVYDNQGYLVWERGKTKTSANISNNINKETSNTADSVYACIKMLIQTSGEGVDIDKIKNEEGSIIEVIDKYINGKAIDYSKTSMSELIYSISEKRPIIAMLSDNKAVLIVGYDESSIVYYDPVSGNDINISMSESETLFGKVGNIYIGYVK